MVSILIVSFSHCISMKKFLLVPSVFGLMFLSACAPAAVQTTDTPDEAMEMSSSSKAAMSSDSSNAMITSSDDSDFSDVKIVEVAVTDWTFTPSTITVHKGDKLVIRLKGGEGDHSFAVTELGINVVLAPGETKDIKIPTDTAGSFEFRCLVPCGPGHKEMKGVIIVE
jgi:heme/copper-type cytochrome/quinol oxidase subunit 2